MEPPPKKTTLTPSQAAGIGLVAGYTLSTFASEYANAIKNAPPGDVQAIAGEQTKLLTRYYEEALHQSKMAFLWAVLTGTAGIAFFLAAAFLLILGVGGGAVSISALAGAVVEVISGISFWMYGRTASQLSVFLHTLILLQRFLLAHSMCDSLSQPGRDETRKKVIGAIAGFA
jgi:hypothetical protein